MDALAHSTYPSEPSHTDTVQGQRGRGTGPACCAVLAHPDLVLGTHAPRDSPSWHIPLASVCMNGGDAVLTTQIGY